MNTTDDEISISRARLDSITVYDVMEEELEIIEAGSPSSLYLNFAIALLSICASLIPTLMLTKIEDTRVFLSFFAVCIVTGIIGVILLIMWYRSNKNVKTIFSKIRSRKAVSALRIEAEVSGTKSDEASSSATSNEPKG